MSTFNFTLPDGKAFNLKGPEGMSFEQAEAILNNSLILDPWLESKLEVL